MLMALIIAVATTLITPVALGGQTKPNLTGTWTLDESRTPSRTNAPGVSHWIVLTIEHTDERFTMRLDKGALTFALDGSETLNRIMSSAGEITVKSRASWDGDKLVLTLDAGAQGTRSQILTLSADGKELTQEDGERRGKLVFRK
jgi:hypothetical protein